MKKEAAGASLRTGLLQLGWQGGTQRRLSVLRQQAPLRALFPLEPDGADAVVVNTGGGVLGGDRLDVEIGLGEGTRAVVTSQAAEKVYRSAGDVAEIRTRLRLAEGATLTWLPQETILFDACRLSRRLEIDLHPDARLLAAEMLVFGRLARGEQLRDGSLREAWDVRIGGRLAWAERFGLEPPNGPLLDEEPLGGGMRAMATVLFAAREAPTALQTARDALDLVGGARGGVTVVNGMLVGRILAADPRMVRQSLARTVAAWRGGLLGESPSVPRLWTI